jgi:hypothetical protein
MLITMGRRLGNLLVRGTVFPGRVNMRRVAAIALASDTDGDRDELSRLCVETSGLGAGVTQLTVSAYRLGSQPAEVSNTSERFLPVPIPVEHHRLTPVLE